MLDVRNLSKSYGHVDALVDVSFELDDGEFAVLLGQSGAGKSTLLRCLNGLTTPTSGSIRLHDGTLDGSQSDVAMVFQQHNLVEGLSAFTNAVTGSLDRHSFVSSLLQRIGREDKLTGLRGLETVGLLDEAHQRVATMSGGQQQRVGIARALVQRPSLMLADEPVASLDPGSAETVMRYLKQAAIDRNITTLVSLHQVNIAAHFGDRFLGLKDGRLVFDGGREDLTPGIVDDLYGDVETVGLSESARRTTSSRSSERNRQRVHT